MCGRREPNAGRRAMMNLKRKCRLFVEKVTQTHIFRSLPRGIDLRDDIKKDLPFCDGGIIFDVGANRGQSAEMFMTWFPKAQIYCFEPAASTFAWLQANFKNSRRVHCYRVALGASKEHGILRLHKKSVNNSLIFSDANEEKTEGVEIETLSCFCRDRNIDRIHFLKIDTEGYDFHVLVGAADMLKNKKIDVIDVEVGMNPGNKKHVPLEKIKAFLEARAYFLFGIYEQQREFRVGQPHMRRSNAVFISEDIIKENTFMQTGKK